MNEFFRGAAAVALSAMALAGCLSAKDVGQLESRSGRAEENGQAFRGVLEAPPGDSDARKVPEVGVRYLFHTHGMGDTSATSTLIAPVEVAMRQAGFAPDPDTAGTDWKDANTAQTYRFQLEAVDCSERWGRSEDKPCVLNTFGKYRIDRFWRPSDGRRVVVYSYFWHEDLWKFQEPFLKHDLEGLKGGFNGWTAGLVSGGLKRNILDFGLSDVAAYLGPAGDPLRDGMAATVCLMLREAAGSSRRMMSAETAKRPDDCLSEDEARKLANGDSRLSFISHSLGSRMLFDVLAPNRDAPRKLEAKPAQGLSATRLATDSFYMAANQLSLLGIARGVQPKTEATAEGRGEKAGVAGQQDVGKTADSAAPGCDTGLPAFLTATDCQVGAVSNLIQDPEGRERRLDLIGFFDPGDVLGFSLEGWLRPGGLPKTVRVVSVLNRNTPQLRLLGVKVGSWPLTAHDHEIALKNGDEGDRFLNPNSAAMIFCGATVDRSGNLKPGLCLDARR